MHELDGGLVSRHVGGSIRKNFVRKYLRKVCLRLYHVAMARPMMTGVMVETVGRLLFRRLLTPLLGR